MAAPLRLVHVPFSRSLRVRWLLEELGVPYALDTVALRDLKRPEHLALHPLGRVPVLIDGELVLYESGAIVQHLLERHGAGRLAPAPGTAERARFWQWFHYAEATLMPPLGLLVRHTAGLPEAARVPAAADDARAQIRAVLGPVERALAGRGWLLPAFSAADVMLGYSVKLASLLGRLGDGMPELTDYLTRCEERPAWRRAVA